MNAISSGFVRALSVLGLTLHSLSSLSANSSVRVIVSADQASSTVTYCYTIINNSQAPVNNLTIGSQFVATENDSFPELGKLPIGWRFGEQGEVGTEVVLDSQGTTQPADWSAAAYGMQDSSFYYLNWSTTPGGSQEVPPGQTRSGFCATVQKGRDSRLSRDRRLSDVFDAAARKYLDGHFNVTLPSVTSVYGNTEVYGSIERIDTTPPVFGVTATPAKLWPPNGKLTPINLNVSVSDDHDSTPDIRLESITANESLPSGEIAGTQLGTDYRQFSLAAKRAGSSPDGRVYSITCSATDASGNRSTVVVKVVVSHDLGQ
jgi:hypothetical protein